VRIVGGPLVIGETRTIQVEIESEGNVNAVGFSIHFDPAALRFIDATTAGGSLEASVYVNASQSAGGKVGIALALGAGQSFPSGSSPLLDLSFEALIPGPVSTALSFGDLPVWREVASVAAAVLSASFPDATVAIQEPPDTDHDGIPNYWESAYGLQPANPSDGTQDLDGDGQANYQEYIAGTHPGDSASSLQIVSIETSGADVQLSINTVAGKSYSLEVNDAFPQDSWNSIAHLTGSGALMQFLDVGAATLTRRMYRVTCP
jgi:hypothetical protein